MKKWLVVMAGALALAVGLFIAWRDDGWPAHEGRLRQTVQVDALGLRRGGSGTLALTALAHYTPRAADDARTVRIRAIDGITVALVDGAGTVTAVKPTKKRREAGATRVDVTLPEVPDGDYTLRVGYRTRLGKGQVDVPLALYAPARVHVITDRPLYEPGNLVRFRAVVLRAHDLAPLDGRPGRWVVTDPQGEVLLEEKAAAGPWGVVAGTFPLDRGSATGAWKLAWRSGDASDEVSFAVRAFTLPRFRVDAQPTRAVYHKLEAPKVEGAVVYASGAPVAGAALSITWEIDGAWPPPTSWQEGGLPTTAVSGRDGTFTLALPEVPADLQGKATLTARISAIDPAGDRVEGSTTVLLAEDRIDVAAVTELGDGLVGGSNNRVYLRVTSADGALLPDTKIRVQRAWQGDDAGIEATTDVDGVASVQLDPGPPVNVVIPAVPYRPAPAPAPVSRGEAEELIAGEGATMADQVELDRWLAALAPCARWYQDDEAEVEVGLRVASAGAVTLAASASPSPLARCVVAALRGKRLPAGRERLYHLTFTFTDPPLPTLIPAIESALDPPDTLDAQLATLAMRARDCLPDDGEGALPQLLSWRATAGSKEVSLGPWLGDPTAEPSSWGQRAMACASQRLAGARVTLDEEAVADGLGVIRFTVGAAAGEGDERPQPTTLLGYELLVTALVPDAPAPLTTRLRLAPGEVPPLRLRLSTVLAAAGDTVTAELLRGPDFARSGRRLPAEVVLSHRKGSVKAKLDDARKATLVVPADAEGWVEVAAAGERALLYVQPRGTLEVAVAPAEPSYAPGRQAELRITTTVGGQGGPAAVGLFGVDESLGQLVTLPGADDLARVQPEVTTTAPAFGVLDGQALALGRIRGANAAAATVLRVGAIPAPPVLDAVVSASATTPFDPIEELTDHFYTVLAELHVQARAWERSAPAAELVKPATMARLWKQALAACARRGEPVVDAYGRKLRLSRLPADLLALTDPRAVIVVGTRLPEDVEDWAAWVAKEKP